MYINQCIVEETNVSKPIQLRKPMYLNQYTVEETSVSKPVYS